MIGETVPKIETGVIHGRFQVFHNDHLKYLLAGMRLCRHLVVGITNPDPKLTTEEAADKKRSSSLANPLTYYERYVMIRTVLEEAGIESSHFSIVPLPINLPELYRYYVPMDAVFFLSIYDDWGRKKLKYFHSLGLKTHVLWEVPLEAKGISAEDVRSRMIHGEPWEHLVPPCVADLMKKWDIPARLRNISEPTQINP
ncbi:MAG: nicotinamide-nucleotide adenylyltransferase [Syntrophus sp. PtaB.Bin075]|nr:MAG: nicotinamide-nucleotide adenylyltransferase [Syntrophus sp. PtaB.Bin075]